MRKALIGLSSPLCYDYRTPATKVASDLSSSPNPILDSPFGLMLLFDEIWFLCRSLCPENMRNLPYVRFLDEEGKLPRVNDLTWERIGELEGDFIRLTSAAASSGLPDFSEAVGRLGIWWEAAADNHTHGIQVGEMQVGGNPTLSNLMFDLVVLDRLRDPGMELVTNSFTQRFFEHPPRSGFESRLTELLILDGISNYLAPRGPYHPCIEEVRENTYLRDFRTWAATQRVHATESELRDVKSAVENVLQRAQDEVFLKYLDRRGHFKTVGKAAVGDALGLLVPGAGVLMAAIEERIGFIDRADQRWQGFIVATRGLKQMKPRA